VSQLLRAAARAHDPEKRVPVFRQDDAPTSSLRIVSMNDRPANTPGHAEQPAADIDAATRRLMAALDALESAVERRREADRDEDELATRIQALGADRSRLADELDGSLVRSRRLERANREIAERLDAAIGTIRAVLGTAAVREEAEEGEEAEEAEENS
jgi:ABC-type transporter Mla subunit MlaD